MIKFKCGSCNSEVELSNDAPTGCPACGLGRGIQITYPQEVITYPPYIPSQTWPTCPCGCGGWVVTCGTVTTSTCYKVGVSSDSITGEYLS